MSNGHLDSDLVAAYAERRLDPQNRSVVEAHLAECADCRREVSEVTLDLARARRRRRLIQAVPLLAAVVVLAVLIRPGSERDRQPATLRPGADPSFGLPALAVRSPGPDAVVQREQLSFRWGGGGPDALYDLTIADSSGLAVWRVRTSDTTLALPDSVRLAVGLRYHWWVDGLLRDGRTAGTGVQQFVLRP
jgi:anti-sigma factor ChrR (cupin superfamily)